MYFDLDCPGTPPDSSLCSHACFKRQFKTPCRWPLFRRLHNNALGALKRRTFVLEMCFYTVEKIFSPDPTPVTHAPENAAFIIEGDGSVEFGNIALIHNQNAVIPYDCLLAVSLGIPQEQIRAKHLPSTDEQYTAGFCL